MNISKNPCHKKFSRLKTSFRLTRSVALNTSPMVRTSARTGPAQVALTKVVLGPNERGPRRHSPCRRKSSQIIAGRRASILNAFFVSAFNSTGVTAIFCSDTTAASLQPGSCPQRSPHLAAYHLTLRQPPGLGHKRQRSKKYLAG